MIDGGLLILGMHRSGTSAVAGQLAALGVYPGSNLLPPQPDNPKGFFEPRAVVELHDEILKLIGATWDDPRPLPEGWADAPALTPYRARLAALIQTEFGSAETWFVKDPRLCRLLPLWRAALGSLGAAPKILLVVRNPSEVVASLNRRSQTDPEQAASLWLAHYAEAEIASRGLNRAVVLYEDWLADWYGQALRVCAELGAEWNITSATQHFVEPSLRHEIAIPARFSAPQNAWAAQFHEALQAWARTGTSPGEMAEQITEDLYLAPRAALPVLAYLREADARAHAAALRLAEASVARGPDIFTTHFLREQERATASAQSLAHERLLLIRQIQASASWRLTKPLRALKRLFSG
jgi:hypothetical protein